jgi:MraZ protein
VGFGGNLWEIVLFCGIKRKSFSIMAVLIGEYELAMDTKGRFLMPSGFRKQLPENMEMKFVVNRGFERCLTLYTMESWAATSGRLMKLNDFNVKVQKLKRLFLNGANIIELDTAGRMLLPKTLQEYAGLKKELVFSAQGNKVEIWDKDTYYNYINQHSAELGDLSNEVFGDDFIDPFQ